VRTHVNFKVFGHLEAAVANGTLERLVFAVTLHVALPRVVLGESVAADITNVRQFLGAVNLLVLL
jgi:hypothetical protein